MTQELYAQVFTDGVLSSFLVPLRSQTAFYAVKAFGEYDAATMQTAALVAALGATLGHMLTFALGLATVKWSKARQHPIYDFLEEPFRRYGVITLLFSWVTLFGFFSFACGVFKVRWYVALTLLSIGQVWYYYSQL